MSTKIDKLNRHFINNVSVMHITGLPHGFISLLGADFVTALYKAISEDQNSFCLIAEDDNNIRGFVAFTENLGKLYKSAVKTNGLGFLMAVGLKIFRPTVFKRIIQNVLYPGKTKKLNLPQAELLSIVVDSSCRGKGIAKQLCQMGLNECQRRGIEKVKVLVAVDNKPANRLYKKCGFKFALKVDSHGVSSNVYVVDLTEYIKEIN